MTIKDAIRVLPDGSNIRIAYADISIDFERKDPLMLDAYGDYVIDELNAFPVTRDKVLFELVVAFRPIKA